MQLEGSFFIEAPREDVWAFLWDTEKISRCVPGVEKVEVESEEQYWVSVKTKVGFLSATFNMSVKILEAEPPGRLVSLFEGKDSKIGSLIKQTNTMELVAVNPSRTELRYSSDVSLTGKLATLGRTIIKGKSKQLMKEFSKNIKREVERSGEVPKTA